MRIIGFGWTADNQVEERATCLSGKGKRDTAGNLEAVTPLYFLYKPAWFTFQWWLLTSDYSLGYGICEWPCTDYEGLISSCHWPGFSLTH